MREMAVWRNISVSRTTGTALLTMTSAKNWPLRGSTSSSRWMVRA
jgi:hypothetical protein